jgi:octaprenyl-diphosphate synthase
LGIERALSFAEEDLNQVEESLINSLSSEVALISSVGRYVFGSGGKRIRPLLTIISSKLCGYNGRLHIPVATAIELIHTATILHDDVVDNSDLRRGRRSVNYLWNSDTSILIGDYLFTKAFCIMVEINQMRILNLMSKTCREIAEGEILELVKTRDISTTEEDYISIAKYKTAVLMASACHVGGILGDVSEEKERAISSFGMNLGIAFQIVDDALDLMADEENLGKPQGKDLEEGKITLPLIHSLKTLKGSERERLIELILNPSMMKRDIKEIIEKIQKSGSIDYTIERAKQYRDEAKRYLDPFPGSFEKELLMELADFVCERGR